MASDDSHDVPRKERRRDWALRKALDGAGSRCRAIAERFAFPYFHLAFRTLVPPGLPIQVFIDGGPRGFREAYESELGAAQDPVLRRALRSLLPFQLHDAVAARDLAANAMLRKLGALGIHDGIAVPMHAPHSSHGMLTLMGPTQLPRSAHLREELFRQVHWMALNSLEGIVDDLTRAGALNVRRQLTERQRRALGLAAEGASYVDIGRQMDVHASTARYLVARALAKLGVDSRAEAVARVAAFEDFSRKLFPARMDDIVLYMASPRTRETGNPSTFETAIVATS